MVRSVKDRVITVKVKAVVVMSQNINETFQPSGRDIFCCR